MSRLFWKAIAAIGSGTVKTTWKYSTSSSSVFTLPQPLRAGERLALGTRPDAGTSCT